MKTSTITISGKSYTLAFDFNLLVQAEQECGFNLLLVINHMDMASAGMLRAVLYALLLTHHPEVKLDQVGALCTLETMPAIAGAIAELFPPEEPGQQQAA